MIGRFWAEIGSEPSWNKILESQQVKLLHLTDNVACIPYLVNGNDPDIQYS